MIPGVWTFAFFQSSHGSSLCSRVLLTSTRKRPAAMMMTIPEYYTGKNVLITGATGFMGKVE